MKMHHPASQVSAIHHYLKPLGLSAAIIALTLSLGTNIAQAAGRVTVSTGLDISTGDYGQPQDTNVLVVPFSVKYRTGAWSYKVATAYQYIQESTGGFLIGGDIIPTANGQTNVSGLGDFIVSARYAFEPTAASDTEFDLTGKVKLGTADVNQGLGTGSNDYTVELGVHQPTESEADIFGSLGYRIKGDLPQQKLNNVWLGSVGFSYPLSDETQFGVVYDYRQASTTRGAAASEISPYWDWRFAQDWSLNTYALFGLSDASPNFGVGTQISHSY